MNATKPDRHRVRGRSIHIGSIELPNVAEIVQSAQLVDGQVGVYFLMRKSASGASLQVVYVGQSMNVYGRVAQHYEAKQFDAWSYVACRPDQLDLIESLYIHWIGPTYNAVRPAKNKSVKRLPGEKVAPIARASVAHLLSDFPATEGRAML